MQSDSCRVRRSLPLPIVTELCLAIVVSYATAPGQPLSAPLQESSGSSPEKIVPYVPTPPEVAQRMLVLAQVGPEDVVYDLGSGDGRIVIMAAQKFGAHAVGVELDPELFQKSASRIAELSLQNRAKILHESFFETNLRPATVVTLYLLTSVNERLRPNLEKQLRPGTRVVSHDFQIPGWKAEKTEDVVAKNGLSHKVYLYVRP